MIPDWQLNILNKMSSFKKGELIMITAGRQVGKSQMLMALHTWESLPARPVENLILTEGRVHGAKYYCVEPVGGNWREMEAWCFKQFGDVGSSIGWQESKNPKCHRWYMNNRKFWFRNEQDQLMFVMKWR